ncbi:hypothetical protein OE749_17695 [Aestuariibacter sp. AA17]|uniref:Uncharacterized protein n=1 Tax=Fluctibacter corallii TaxID=2984329 RepID=A0ABT3ACX5_9ALTE|nr:hypothetical protein [Aestuariibacter sp. AA17]MCV2886534.1 hypothetical protein [Aestuariibacter sp. AA17]
MSSFISSSTKTSEAAKSKLAELGLSREILERAIQEGLFQFKKVTKLHPVTAGGSRAWEEVNASLREQLLQTQAGWNMSHEKGLTLTFNKSLGVNIVVTSGDRHTGIKEGFPKTKNTKGASTQNYVGVNYSLFGDDEDVVSIFQEKIDKTETWVLLYHIDTALKQVRFELSLPSGMSGSNGKIRIDSWEQRIIFNPVPFNSDVTPTDKPEFNEDISFDVTKKVE